VSRGKGANSAPVVRSLQLIKNAAHPQVVHWLAVVERLLISWAYRRKACPTIAGDGNVLVREDAQERTRIGCASHLLEQQPHQGATNPLPTVCWRDKEACQLHLLRSRIDPQSP
jgi:hypothetical protein